jgi:hypothetical protein
MKKSQMSRKVMAIGCAFALALAVVIIVGVSAKAQEETQEEAQANTLIKHVLNGTYYNFTSGGHTSCDTSGCVATVNVSTVSIPCPGTTGVKCTYEVSIAAQSNMESPGTGLYQFLVDGAIPNGGGGNGGGGTDPNGFWTWSISGPMGPGPLSGSAAYTVSSQVTNTGANQSHSIVVNLACDMGNPGCTVNSGQTTLTVRVLKP